MKLGVGFQEESSLYKDWDVNVKPKNRPSRKAAFDDILDGSKDIRYMQVDGIYCGFPFFENMIRPLPSFKESSAALSIDKCCPPEFCLKTISVISELTSPKWY